MSTHAIIQTLTARIVEECKPVDREAAFDQSLDSEGEVNVAGLTFYPSQIWKEMDPIAYRCGVNDFADGEAWVEIDGETYRQDEVEAVIEEFKDGLESELSELEEELENMDIVTAELREEGADAERIAESEKAANDHRKLVAEKRTEIAAVAADPFFS